MPSYFLAKDKKIRFFLLKNEFVRIRFQYFLKNFNFLRNKNLIKFLFLKKLKWTLRYSVKYRNRCIITGRSGSIITYFKFSRILFKDFASNGFLPGISHSSW